MIRLGLGGVPRSVATIVCLLMLSFVFAITPPSATKEADARSPATKEAGARSPRRSPIDVPEEFRADLSESASRGIGVRLDHLSSGLYVDLRIKGYAGQEPARRANEGQRETRVEFAPSPGIKVTYEAARNEVKETIVLSEPGPEEFRYKINSPGLKPRQEGESVVFDSRRHLGLFRIHGLRVWDAAGESIRASLTLEGNEAVVRLDHEALLSAHFPITIDPIISGQLGHAPHTRKLFETSDGKLVLFHMVSVSNSWSLAYSVSSDGGNSWGEPILIGTVPGVFGVAAEKGPDDSFYVTYPSGPEGSVFIAFRTMTRLSNGSWSVGVEKTVGTGEVMLWPRPSIADLGQSANGRKLAIGFVRKNPLGADEYAISFSDDSGQTWSGAFKCDDAQIGTLAAQGARLFCIVQGNTKDLEAREWLGLSWGPPATIPVGYFPCGAFMPSTVTTDDGRLHLVVSASPVNDCLEQRVQYASISQGSSEWSVPSVLGKGTLPVISTTGSALEVFAQVGVGFGEGKIHSYVARDGITWSESGSFSGGPFAHVLDENKTWAFQDDFDSGDALFSITDSQGQWGNRIGISSTLHKLHSQDKKLSMSFIPQSGGSVSSLILWNTANNSPTYRIGIQSDCAAVNPSCQGIPSGSWLLDLALSGSWGDVTPSNSSSITPLTVTLGHAVDLGPGVRYHVIIQPVSDPTGVNSPTADKWMAVQTVGADSGAEGSMRALENSGTGWTSVIGEVPRLIATNSTGSPFIQDLQPNWWFPSASKYSIPGESFVAPRDIVPTSLKVYLTRNGQTDSPVTLRILNQSGTQLWSHQTTPAGEGWLSLPVSGVTLTEGSRYRLVVDSPAGGSFWNHWNLGAANGWNHWNLGTSQGWDGDSSGLTRAPDRPGVNDRTAEASDNQFSTDYQGNPDDFWAFNSSTSDAIYLGDNQPFDFARIWAAVHLGVSLSFAYWNGSSWAPLTITGSGSNFSGMRIAEWQPPSDWSQVTVDGRNAYWIRVTNSADSVTPLRTFRTTSIRNFRYPTAAPRGSSHIPVAWEDNDFERIVTWAYDVLSPIIGIKTPAPGENLRESRPPIELAMGDGVGDGVDSSTLAVFLDGSRISPTWNAQSGTATYTPSQDLSKGEHFVTATVSDSAGNPSTLFSTVFSIVDYGTVTERTARTITYANLDGTRTTVSRAGRMHYQDAEGIWRRVDARLIPSPSGFANVAGLLNLLFAPMVGSGDLVKVSGSDWSVGFRLEGSRVNRLAQVDGPDVRYTEILPSTDLLYRATANGLKELITIKEAPAGPTVFRFPINLTGVTATATENAISFRDASGEEVAFIPPGIAFDSSAAITPLPPPNIETFTPPASSPVAIRLVTINGSQAIEVEPDAAWLLDPARVYPVMIDPTIERRAGLNGQDAFIDGQDGHKHWNYNHGCSQREGIASVLSR